jgi:rod shape-determining protein MreD
MFRGGTIYSRILFGAVILFILVFFQSLLSEVVTIMGIKFDLAIVILVYIALNRGPNYGMAFGFLIGFLLDIFTPQTLGWGALVKCLIGFTMGSFKDNLYLESLYSKGGVIFFALMVNDFLYYIFANGVNASTFRILGHASVPSAFYTSIVGVLIILAWSRIRWGQWSIQKGSG